jgi:hypothetical protein
MPGTTTPTSSSTASVSTPPISRGSSRGNSAAEHGSLLTQVHKRFGVIYQQVKE